MNAMPNNLPYQLSSFIGREREIAEVKRLLVSSRLVTLIGAGGCGKTALALHVAQAVLDAYADGVCWVELAPLSDTALLPQTVMKALGLVEQRGRSLMETLLDFLKETDLLLILDNCEHFIDAAARLVDGLLTGGAELRVLATSREALNIAGELAWIVPSLQVPDASALPVLSRLQQCDSVRLFVERASATQSDFKLTPQNAAAVARICRRLDGIPLAIELAAARVKVLSVDQIAARLDDALGLLTEGKRTAPQRHQTLRATMDWSYDLLTAAEQMLFRRVSVFAGGFTLQAVEEVCAGNGLEPDKVLNHLTHLVDKSLVLKQEQAGEARYRLIEAVRQYADSKWHESADAGRVQSCHLKFFLDLAEQAAHVLRGGAQQHEWLGKLDAEQDNLRSAFAWAMRGSEIERGLQLASALVRYWVVRGSLTEGRQWMDTALLHAEAASVKTQAAIALAAGFMLFTQEQDPEARPLLERSTALARQLDDKPVVADSLRFLGGGLGALQQPEASRDALAESLALYRELNEPWGIAMTLIYLSDEAIRRREHGAARSFLEESLPIFRRIGDKRGMGWALVGLGYVAQAQSDDVTAAALAQEALDLFSAVGDKRGIGRAWVRQGFLAYGQRNWARAAALLSQCLRLYYELGSIVERPSLLAGLAGVAGATGDFALAARLRGAADSLSAANNRPFDPELITREIATARRALGEERYAAEWAKGKNMTVEQVVTEAEQVTGAPATLSAHDPNALTPRELDVLRLLAQRMSDAEIADKLVISRRTVSTHLTAIYSKFGVNSRRAALRYTLEHKLI